MVNTCDFTPAMWCFKYKLSGLAFNCNVLYLGLKGYTSIFFDGLQLLLLDVAHRSLLQKWEFWSCRGNGLCAKAAVLEVPPRC